MREPLPDWSPLEVTFKILDEHPHLFYIRVPPLGNIVIVQGKKFSILKKAPI